MGRLLCDPEKLFWLPTGGHLVDVASDAFEATLKRRFKKASEGRIGKYLRLVRRRVASSPR